MINVLQGTPTITWANPAAITYGTALSGTQLDATASVPGTFTYTPGTGTVLKAGLGQTLSATFTPTDTTDYTSATTTAIINVLQATPTISWANAASIVYGTALSGTQLDATASVPGTFTYTPAAGTVLEAGNSQSLSVTFTPSDTTDYTSVTTTAVINVLQATPAITWANPAAIVYGTALSGTQLDATASVPGTFTYAPAAGTVLKAGLGQTLSVTFTPSDTTDYTSATATTVINVLQATPAITWANPAAIVYGTALSGTQLDATASVPGTFTYSLGTGTILKASNGQTLSVTFMPTDTTDYASATTTTVINVLTATPTITWANPAAITSVTALSGTQLDATSAWTVGGVSGSVAGTFTYTPAAGTVLGIGNNQTLSVSFAPMDTTDFKSANATVQINVSAPPASAVFLTQDTTTEGNWIGTYGTQGYDVIGNAASLPRNDIVSPSGQSSQTWPLTPSDQRALEDASGIGRAAAYWYSNTSFTVNVDLGDGQMHNLELYFVDWDSTSRSEQVQITAASSGAVLDTETVSSFHSGVYLDWQVSGDVVITITDLAGANAVLSGLFLNPATVQTTSLVAANAATQVNWIGEYGTQGYDVIGNAASLPNYATVTPSGQSSYTWAASTTDPRALENANDTGYIAACWYSATSFTVDVNLTDGQAHDLTLYAVDWDSEHRSEQIQILSATTGAVLDTETISSFSGGTYLQWVVTGNVLIKVTNLAGPNAVLSGLFIDPAN